MDDSQGTSNNNAISNKAGARGPLTTFPLFVQLPLEIQRKIWREAIRQIPRGIHFLTMFHPVLLESTLGRSGKVNREDCVKATNRFGIPGQQSPFARSESATPVVLLACRSETFWPRDQADNASNQTSSATNTESVDRVNLREISDLSVCEIDRKHYVRMPPEGGGGAAAVSFLGYRNILLACRNSLIEFNHVMEMEKRLEYGKKAAESNPTWLDLNGDPIGHPERKLLCNVESDLVCIQIPNALDPAYLFSWGAQASLSTIFLSASYPALQYLKRLCFELTPLWLAHDHDDFWFDLKSYMTQLPSLEAVYILDTEIDLRQDATGYLSPSLEIFNGPGSDLQGNNTSRYVEVKPEDEGLWCHARWGSVRRWTNRERYPHWSYYSFHRLFLDEDGTDGRPHAVRHMCRHLFYRDFSFMHAPNPLRLTTLSNFEKEEAELEKMDPEKRKSETTIPYIRFGLDKEKLRNHRKPPIKLLAKVDAALLGSRLP